MTEKLYYEDAYCKEFEAVVLSCREGKKGYEIVLDRTAFYPEGGGQPGDRGWMYEIKVESCCEKDDDNCQKGDTADGGNDIRILDTHEKDGEIIHYADRPLLPGARITGQIDWDFRFDLMQNHSGEHIVSGLIHEAFGYDNVGFHMGKDVLTIDLSGELTREQMDLIEERANAVVWANASTDISCYTEEEAKAVEYRSKKELHGTVRVVTFPGADVCACCGTHVKQTGEIGLIKLLSSERFKGGVRLEMLCGRRAYEYVSKISRQNHRISVALSAKTLQTAEAVLRLKEAEQKTSLRAGRMEAELFAAKAKQLADAGDVLLFEEQLSSDSVRRLASAVMETCGGRCVVCSGDDQNGYKYAIGQTDGDLRELVRELNRCLNGRGGGKPFFVQGSIAASRREIEDFFDVR